MNNNLIYIALSIPQNLVHTKNEMKVHGCLFLLFSLILSVSGNSILRKFKKIFADNSVCTLDVRKDFAEQHTPLLFESDVFIYPERKRRRKSIFTLQKGEVITMACPGRYNKVVGYEEQKINFKCEGGTDLQAENHETIASKDIHCITPVEYTIKEGETCFGDEGKSAKIGFEVDGVHYPTFLACYNEIEKVTYWTYHEIKGDIIAGRANHIKHGIDDYKVGQIEFPIAEEAPIVKAYSKDVQFTVLARIAGLPFAEKVYYEKKWSLMPAQFTPAEDFITAAEQRSTYFLVDTTPVWSSVRTGNLFTLEEMLRDLAAKKVIDLYVLTGTIGKLEPDDKHNMNRKQVLHLEIEEKMDPKTIVNVPVPEHIWKLVITKETKECMAFIIRNEPYRQEKPPFLCDNECEKYNWQFKNNKFDRGYIYCCILEKFSKIIPKPLPNIECVTPLTITNQ